MVAQGGIFWGLRGREHPEEIVHSVSSETTRSGSRLKGLYLKRLRMTSGAAIHALLVKVRDRRDRPHDLLWL